jgi:bifunctional non-homologous end joining protein LigD
MGANMSRVPQRLGFIEPQLPTSTDQPPEGEEWIHEVKHDGYRTLLLVEDGQARAFTRKGFDWSDSYRGIVSAVASLDCRSAILDGEVIVQDGLGISDLEALRSAIKWAPHRLLFYAFDLLHLNGEDLRCKPLIERRTRLKELIGDDAASPLQFSEEFTGDGAAFFRACAEHGLEGVVSKRAASLYRSGRSKTWLKSKCFTESEFMLIGVDRDRKTGAERALLAKAERSGLVYAGAAFFALGREERETLAEKLEALLQEQPTIPWLRNRQARWVRPELTLRVKYLAGSRLLRHATVQSIS